MFGSGGVGGLFGGGGQGGVFGSLFGPRFSCELKCLPVSFVGREELEFGNRLILPAAALEQLQALNAPSPYLFEISDLDDRRHTHGGVLEFTAPEDTCYMPYWILQQLQVQEGDVLRIVLKQLPKATFALFKPASVALLRVYDQRALLESGLRGFVTLSVGDSFAVEYNGQKYGIEVVQLRPENAAHLVDTDMEVEFTTPKDAEAAASRAMRQASEDEDEASPKGVVFSGVGQTIAGAKVEAKSRAELEEAEEEDEFASMPWKRRIPKGVKWTSPPYGFDPARICGENYGARSRGSSPSPPEGAAAAQGSNSSPRGAAGARATAGTAARREASPEEIRVRKLEAAEVRYAMNAEEIAQRRREEEEAQDRERLRQEQAEKERREREEEAARKKMKSAEAIAPQQQSMKGAKDRGSGSRSPSKEKGGGCCCSCFRQGSGGQPAKDAAAAGARV